MKTRIISGLIMGVIVMAVLALGYTINPIFITVFIALVAPIATYELIHNVAKIKSKTAIIVSTLYTAIGVVNFALGGFKILGYTITTYHITVVYVLIAVFVILKKHKEFDLSAILSICVMPFIMAYAFGSLEKIANFGAVYGFELSPISTSKGIYYLLMMLNFSSLCDMGAYFVGVTIGKHNYVLKSALKKPLKVQLAAF